MKKSITTTAAIAAAAILFVNNAFASVTPIGDVDRDGILTASDSAVIMQHVLNKDFKMPIEKTRSYMYIADADGDDMLTSADAAAVMQKVLNDDFKLANEGKTHKQWLERKGKDSLELFKKEMNDAKTVFAAAQTYATDLYAAGKWSESMTIRYPELISAGLLADDAAYYKYMIYPNTSGGIDIDKVTWTSHNSPYGAACVYPRDAYTDELETEWDGFDENSDPADMYAQAKNVFSAAQSYATDLYTQCKWTGENSIDIDDLLSAGLLYAYPSYHFTIEPVDDKAYPGIKQVTWDAYGRRFRYPADYQVLSPHALYDASVVFSAAQTYATDLYTQNKWSGNKEITADELVNAGLLVSKPDIEYIIVNAGFDNTPAIHHVEFKDSMGYTYCYPGYPGISGQPGDGAATIFAAAQTYATDLYTRGCWSKNVKITIDDLIREGLLLSMPIYDYKIKIVENDDIPAIDYVTWKYSDGSEGQYPEYAVAMPNDNTVKGRSPEYTWESVYIAAQ